MERRTFLKLAALVPGLALAGCGGSKTLLSPKDPTMLSIWHVYGEQADSPMNRLLTEFNDTVGREKGILLNVTNMTNSAAIGGQLQDAKAGKPGALDLPDLFSAHPADASALGIENLVDWNDWFTAEDMAAYVPGFVQDGIIEGRQVVFPVSKSTQLIFLNGSQYARFAADTGAQLSTLATWDGFFEMAGAYRQWSQGKPFCALDYPLRLVELNALEQGSGELYKGSWYDLTNETFRASWMEFARALVQGDILISDLYSNTQVMTGETLAGLGSSAAILYYNDFVTYPDNTTEPTDLLLAPLPHAAGTATPLMPQAGVGLCAFKTTGQKAEAAAASSVKELAVAFVSKLGLGTPETAIPPFNTKLITDDELDKNMLVAAVNGATLKKLGLYEGNRIVLTSKAGKVMAKIRVFEGVTNDTVALTMGFGHTAFGEFNDGKGMDVMALVTPSSEPGSGLSVWNDTRVNVAQA